MTAARYRRGAGVTERRIDDAVFLVGPDDVSVYHLNATGAAIWHLLEEPTGIEEAIKLLANAFPDTPAARIREDVEVLMAELARREFVEPTD